MRNFIRKIDIILISIIIGLLLIIAYYSVPFADDFCKQYDDSVINTIISLFKTGDGRFLSFTGLFMTLGFKYLSFNQMSILWLVFFIGSLILITKLIAIESKSKYFIFLTTLVLVLIGSESYFNQVVFWATGGSVYSVSTFFALLYLYVLKKYGFNPYALLIGILFTAIGPNYTIPMLIIIVLELIHGQNYSLKQKIVYSLYFLIIFSLGILLIIFAPGTEQRLGTVSTFWMWHPRYVTEAVLRVLLMSFKFYPISVLLLLFILSYEFYLAIKQNSQSILNRLFTIIYNLRFLFASLVSVLVFVKTPGLLSGRAAFFFYILIIIQALCTFFKIPKIRIEIPVKIVSFTLIVVLFVTLLKIILFSKRYSKDLKNNKVKREYILQNYVYNNINQPFKRTEKLKRDELNIWAEQCFDNYQLRK